MSIESVTTHFTFCIGSYGFQGRTTDATDETSLLSELRFPVDRCKTIGKGVAGTTCANGFQIVNE